MRLRPLPAMVTGIVQLALEICDQTEYRVPGLCRGCHGHLSGYDTRLKRFAILVTEDGEKRISVILHRAYCRDCGRIWTPGGPFYPGTRIGSPVVDLCRTLYETMPSGQVATRLNQMGVRIDRWSVHSYCKTPFSTPPTIKVFDMKIPISIVSLSSLSESRDHSGNISGDDVLAACSYPSGDRSQH